MRARHRPAQLKAVMKEGKKPVMSLGKKIFLVVGFFLLLGALLSAFLLRDPDGRSEQQKCDDYCMKEYGLRGRLERIITNQPANPGAYKGPWKCTCPR